MRYILVGFDEDMAMLDATDFCKRIEGLHDDVKAAVIVREANVMSEVDPSDVYLGTFWTTPQAKERIMP